MSEAKGFRDDPAKVLSGKNGEFDGHSYNYLVRTIYLHSIMPDQREEASFFSLIHSTNVYLAPTMSQTLF